MEGIVMHSKITYRGEWRPEPEEDPVKDQAAEKEAEGEGADPGAENADEGKNPETGAPVKMWIGEDNRRYVITESGAVVVVSQ